MSGKTRPTLHLDVKSALLTLNASALYGQVAGTPERLSRLGAMCTLPKMEQRIRQNLLSGLLRPASALLQTPRFNEFRVSTIIELLPPRAGTRCTRHSKVMPD